ncbi:hypothetical protein JCM6882_002107 [Rhodosporidiobolus microsporus]
MAPKSDKITFLLNWRVASPSSPHFNLGGLRRHATPYHAPVFLAQSKGYFADEDLKVAILEPTDPSDVTELIGRGTADMGAKAMVHTIAAAARGYPVTSIGTILDEIEVQPFTGVIYLEGGVPGKSEGLTEDFRSLKGKKIGYVGEFGKIQIDELTKHYGLKPEDYTAVRCGMDISAAIIEGRVDGGIGIDAVQMVELEEWCKEVGRPATDVKMHRIDQLAELGCCCFCSILCIVNDKFLEENPEKVAGFMRALKRAADDIQRDPVGSWEAYKAHKKTMRTTLNEKIYERCFTYFSKDLKCVERDWHKVTNYSRRLGLIDDNFKQNFTNKFVSWEHEPEPSDPLADQERIAKLQENVRINGGVLSSAPAVAAGVTVLA